MSTKALSFIPLTLAVVLVGAAAASAQSTPDYYACVLLEPSFEPLLESSFEPLLESLFAALLEALLASFLA